MRRLMAVFMMMAMSVSMAVIVVMPMFVGMAADFHVAAAETASTFFAHKFISKSSFQIFAVLV